MRHIVTSILMLVCLWANAQDSKITPLYQERNTSLDEYTYSAPNGGVVIYSPFNDLHVESDGNTVATPTKVKKEKMFRYAIPVKSQNSGGIRVSVSKGEDIISFTDKHLEKKKLNAYIVKNYNPHIQVVPADIGGDIIRDKDNVLMMIRCNSDYNLNIDLPNRDLKKVDEVDESSKSRMYRIYIPINKIIEEEHNINIIETKIDALKSQRDTDPDVDENVVDLQIDSLQRIKNILKSNVESYTNVSIRYKNSNTATIQYSGSRQNTTYKVTVTELKPKSPISFVAGIGCMVYPKFSPVLKLGIEQSIKKNKWRVDIFGTSPFLTSSPLFLYNNNGDNIGNQEYTPFEFGIKGGYWRGLGSKGKVKLGLVGGYGYNIVKGNDSNLPLNGASFSSFKIGPSAVYSITNWLSFFANAEYRLQTSNEKLDIITKNCSLINDWTKPFGAIIGVKFSFPTR